LHIFYTTVLTIILAFQVAAKANLARRLMWMEKIQNNN